MIRRILKREGGQGMAEMAFILPLILVIIVGVIEVGDSMNAYITLVDSARDGARLGSKNVATDGDIKNLVMIETNRLRDDVTADDVTITHVTVDGKDAIRVEVFNERSLIMSIPLVMPDSFRMCSTTTMHVLPG